MLLLCAAALFMIGILLGWLLRANVREKELNAEISTLRLDLQNTRRQYNETKEEFNLHAADARKAILEAENLRNQVAVLEQEKGQKQGEIERGIQAIEQYEMKLQKLQASTVALEERVVGIRTQNAQLVEENKILSEEVAVYQSKKLEREKTKSDALLLESTLVDLEKERNKAIADADEMASQSSSLRQELAKSDSDIAILKVQLSRLETELSSTQGELERLRAEAQAAMPSAAISNSSVQQSTIAPVSKTIEPQQQPAAPTISTEVEEEAFDAADALLQSYGGLKPRIHSTVFEEKQEAIISEAPSVDTFLEGSDTPAQDDLQIINGVSAKNEAKLHAIGISTFRQLASLASDIELLRKVSKALKVSQKRIKEEDWAGQAQHLLEVQS